MFSQFGIQVDTTNFTEEDVQAFCRILEEIHEKREQCEKRKANIQQYPSKAVMTHHEIFDSIGSSTKNNNFTQKLMKSYQKVSPLNKKNGTRPSKLRQQLIGHVDLLLSPKSSPSSKRKINYTSKSVDFDINDEKFHQLSVKEKALWYEKTKTHQLHNTFQMNRHSENNFMTKKNYVKHLRDLWEARLNTSVRSNESSLSLKRRKKKSLDYSFPKKGSQEKIMPRKSCEEPRNKLQLTLKSNEDETNHSAIGKLRSMKTVDDDNINLSKTINFEPNSSAEYPESQDSVDSYSTNSEESSMEVGTHRRKHCHCANGKDKQDKLNWNSDLDTEPKTLQTVTLPSELNCDTQNNICANEKHHDHVPNSSILLNHDFANSSTKSGKSFQFDLYSPKKVISVYTLTAMSTPTSAQSNIDTDHDEYPKPLEKEFISKCSSVILDKQSSALRGDTYTDQGFETGSNDTQSPIRDQKANYSIEGQLKHFAVCSTPNRDDIRCFQHNLPNGVSPIKVNNKNNEKHRTSESPENLLANTASEFWITFGNYTISLKIHHCPWERLLLLRKAFVQHQIKENIEINFGIDKQIFPLHSKTILLIKELIQRLPKKNYTNYSLYWFCKGNVLLPFKGPVITTAKIQGIFTCLQVFRDQNDGNGKCCECLTFGIDNYVFFTSHNSKSSSANSSKLSDQDYNEV